MRSVGVRLNAQPEMSSYNVQEEGREERGLDFEETMPPAM